MLRDFTFESKALCKTWCNVNLTFLNCELLFVRNYFFVGRSWWRFSESGYSRWNHPKVCTSFFYEHLLLKKLLLWTISSYVNFCQSPLLSSIGRQGRSLRAVCSKSGNGYNGYNGYKCRFDSGYNIRNAAKS